MRTFTSLIGNDSIKSRLSDAIINNTLPHALLISGPVGSGRKTLARAIALARNCEAKGLGGANLPCLICNTCKRIAEENYTDVKYLRKSGGKASIGVEELRDFKEDMYLSATESQYKFYIIEEADALTPAAQNALLKVLEEPPRGVHIILISSSQDKILSTIKSRTQYIQMELFSVSDIKRHLITLSDKAERLSHVAPDTLGAVAVASGGVIGRGLSLLDGEGGGEAEEDKRIISELVSSLEKKTPFAKLLESLSAIPQKREGAISALERLLSALRDIIITKNDGEAELLFFLNRDECERYSGGISLKRAVMIYDVITAAIRDIERNAIISTVLSDVAVKIRST